jgi:hypothetical protein
MGRAIASKLGLTRRGVVLEGGQLVPVLDP